MEVVASAEVVIDRTLPSLVRDAFMKLVARSPSLVAVLGVECLLRAATSTLVCVAGVSGSPVSSNGYLTLLTCMVMTFAPLTPALFATSWTGFVFTVVTCTLPACALPIVLSRISHGVLIHTFGCPEGSALKSALVRPTWLALLSTVAALLSGPTGTVAGPHVGVAALATTALLSLRILWTIIRLHLVMPACMISRTTAPPRSQRDRRLAELAVGDSCTMSKAGTQFDVSRLRLERGLEALAITHPLRSNKWVLTLSGNGEFLLDGGFETKLQLASDLGCSLIACDYRGVGRSAGALLAAADMVEDAAACVRYCEGALAGADPSSSILLLGQSMGGGVAAELAATHFPHLPCVNLRSFGSLADVSLAFVGLGGSTAALGIIRLVLALAFSRRPWQPPLETTSHWRRLRSGNKLLIYHGRDEVIGHAASLHTALHLRGELEGTDVIELRGRSLWSDHNDNPAAFSKREWADALAWMRRTLRLAPE